MSFDLPSDLKAALDRLTHGLSRKALAERAAAISATYRGGGSSTLIRNRDDALAYAMSRMPATFAAVVATLAELAKRRTDYTPASLLDVGAGPGTATFAAADAFPSLTTFVQLETNPALASLAIDLARDSVRLSALRQEAGDARQSIASAAEADLVIASYVIGELSDSARPDITDALWRKTRDTLLVVEPGTPAGTARIIALRTQLIAAGARVIVPCPHGQACPLTPPDWCHFTQRLARSRDHMQVKDVALPFEDEKFAYVALARAPLATRPAARVLAQPVTTKIEVTAKLCMADGTVRIAKVARRDKGGYGRAKRWQWGDAVDAG